MSDLLHQRIRHWAMRATIDALKEERTLVIGSLV